MLKGWTTGRLLSWLKWSEGRLKNFVAQRYGPLLRFNTTPVYDVTLAEDTTCAQATPYDIDVSAFKARNFWLYFKGPQQSTASVYQVLAITKENVMRKATISLYSNTSPTWYASIRFSDFHGGIVIQHGCGNPNSSSNAYETNGPFFYANENDYISKIRIQQHNSDNPDKLFANTRITVYAAKEAE